MEEYLEFAKDIAKEAGKIMLKYFNAENISSYKGDKTIVTIADKEINSYLIKRVKETYPTHSVDGEEEQFGDSNYKWICDPVDGTAMYARHIPVAVFSLALVIDGVSQIGIVNDVFTGNIYTAIKGQGAFKNDKKISVNDYPIEDMKSIINFDMWPSCDYNIYDVIKELGKTTYILSIGSVIKACLCVASGEFVAAIFPGTFHKNCDIAAVKVIVEEAGGKVTSIFGKDQRYDKNINGALITNSNTHDTILNIINNNIKNNY